MSSLNFVLSFICLLVGVIQNDWMWLALSLWNILVAIYLEIKLRR